MILRPLALVALAAALAPATRAVAQDDLQGSWSVVSVEQGGQRYAADEIAGQKVIFENGKYRMVNKTQQPIESGTYKLDPSKTPRQADFKIEKGEGAGETQLAIYKINGDDFTMCLSIPGEKSRPGSFTPKAVDNQVLFVLKRDKP